MQKDDDTGWVFTHPVKPENLTEDGEKAYLSLYFYFFHSGEIWLDSKDVMINAATLFTEFGTEMRNMDGIWSIPDQLLEAAARKYNQNCSSGAWSSGCFNGYWGYMQGTRTVGISQKVAGVFARIVDGTLGNIKQLQAVMKAAQQIHDYQVIGVGNGKKEENKPYEWVNVYSYNPIQVDYKTQLSSPENYWFIALTPAQKRFHCGSDTCNLSNKWIEQK